MKENTRPKTDTAAGILTEGFAVAAVAALLLLAIMPCVSGCSGRAGDTKRTYERTRQAWEQYQEIKSRIGQPERYSTSSSALGDGALLCSRIDLQGADPELQDYIRSVVENLRNAASFCREVETKYQEVRARSGRLTDMGTMLGEAANNGNSLRQNVAAGRLLMGFLAAASEDGEIKKIQEESAQGWQQIMSALDDLGRRELKLAERLSSKYGVPFLVPS